MSDFYFQIKPIKGEFEVMLECIKTFKYKGEEKQIIYAERMPYGTKKNDITKDHREYIMNYINNEILQFKLNN